jgi:hypothetical protein
MLKSYFEKVKACLGLIVGLTDRTIDIVLPNCYICQGKYFVQMAGSRLTNPRLLSKSTLRVYLGANKRSATTYYKRLNLIVRKILLIGMV